jgi:hypothetical protein
MCKFCERLEIKKDVHELVASCVTGEELSQNGKWMQELTVAIVERNWYQKRGKRTAGRTVSYRNNGLGFALNYCPECGKKL